MRTPRGTGRSPAPALPRSAPTSARSSPCSSDPGGTDAMRRRLSTIAALITCATVVAALSVGVAPAGAAKQPVVTIGVVAPLDAGLTSFGQGIANSTQLAVDQANKTKAIPGWKIKYEEVNDSSDGATGAKNVTQLLNDKTVVGIVGPYNSGVSLAVLPV